MLVLEEGISGDAAYLPPLLEPVEGQNRQRQTAYEEKSSHDARWPGQDGTVDLRRIDSAPLGRRLALVMDKANRARRGT